MKMNKHTGICWEITELVETNETHDEKRLKTGN